MGIEVYMFSVVDMWDVVMWFGWENRVRGKRGDEGVLCWVWLGFGITGFCMWRRG